MQEYCSFKGCETVSILFWFFKKVNLVIERSFSKINAYITILFISQRAKANSALGYYSIGCPAIRFMFHLPKLYFEFSARDFVVKFV
jgi:hypothetical protein